MNIKKKIPCNFDWPGTCIGNHLAGVFRYYGKNSMLDEVKDALKGTAAAYTGTYDQNTGDYMETSNGDI